MTIAAHPCAEHGTQNVTELGPHLLKLYMATTNSSAFLSQTQIEEGGPRMSRIKVDESKLLSALKELIGIESVNPSLVQG